MDVAIGAAELSKRWQDDAGAVQRIWRCFEALFLFNECDFQESKVCCFGGVDGVDDVL